MHALIDHNPSARPSAAALSQRRSVAASQRLAERRTERCRTLKESDTCVAYVCMCMLMCAYARVFAHACATCARCVRALHVRVACVLCVCGMYGTRVTRGRVWQSLCLRPRGFRPASRALQMRARNMACNMHIEYDMHNDARMHMLNMRRGDCQRSLASLSREPPKSAVLGKQGTEPWRMP